MEEKNERSMAIFIWFTFPLFFSLASQILGGMHNDLEHVMYKREAAIIKTFEIDRNVIDCIDIYKQPALQHPLLVNHIIQLKPNYPSMTSDHVMEAHHPWNLSESCPEGSIPIERAEPNGHFGGNRSRSNWYNAPPYIPNIIGPDGYDHEYAIFRSHGTVYGAKATMNVWNPKVEKTDFSASQMWVASKDGQTSLEADWVVLPRVNGNNQTRFFLFWTTNNYSSSCYNLQCPGFVQTNKRSIINPYLRPVSVFGGPQYAIDVEIFKDRANGNWWLRLQGVDMGYWPEELVPNLAAGAYYVDFGGEIEYAISSVPTTTQMGSGHFPEEGYKKSSFFRNLLLLRTDHVYRGPDVEETVADKKGCYDIQVGGNKGSPWGWFFFYGGPGRSEKCVY